jgi:hypothetical protein
MTCYVSTPENLSLSKEEQLLGSYDTIQDALGAGAREFGMVSFLVKRTDEVPQDVSIPALTLGILRADPSHPTDGAG